MKYKEKIYSHYVSNHNQLLYGEMSIEKIECSFRLWDHLYGFILPKEKNQKILDIGCGEGGFVHYLENKGYDNVFGIDVSKEQIELGKELGIKNIAEADLSIWLKSNVEMYDLVIARDVLEHFTRQEVFDIIKQIKNSLICGGSLVFQSPNGEGLMVDKIYEGDFTHSTKFTEDSAKQILSSIGFNTIQCRPLLFPVMSFSSLFRMFGWKCLEFSARVIRKIIYGSGKGIFTPNLLIAAIKPESSNK